MGRLIAIGDIHGCHQTLRKLMDEKLAPSKNDTLVFLGDYMDRGPDSKSVIDYLIQLENDGYNTIFLRGNHEQTLMDAIDAEKTIKKGWFTTPKNTIFQSWYEKFGGRETFQSYGITEVKQYPQDHEQWCRNLKLYHETAGYYFVHAGFNFDEEDILADTDAMLWLREFDYDAQKANGKKVVHGHVPVTVDFVKECLSKPELGFVPLDTGCVYRERVGMGYLSAFDFTNQVLYSVKNIDR